MSDRADGPLSNPDIVGLPTSTVTHPDGRPYLQRFHLIDTHPFSARYHHWLTSDDDRAPHDHPWPNLTIVLAGHLIEHTDDGTRDLTPGTIVPRAARTPHRLELISDDAWTLFVTGPPQRQWGFHTPLGWINARHYPHTGHTTTGPQP
jgi:hypothetical protein